MATASAPEVASAGPEQPQASEASATHDENGDETAASNAEEKKAMPRSAAFSVLDSAGGLLVDPSLAAAAVDTATQVLASSPTGSTSPVTLGVSPDLSMAASARCLAAVLAAVQPVVDMSHAFGCESSSPGFSGLSSALGLVPRVWNQHGFQIFSPEDCGEPVALGLTGVNGLLGIAAQWRSSEHVAATTVVVLTNELSMAAVPAALVREICTCLQLPHLLDFPS
jgi:hypothetical protein